jgi:zinc protease
MAVGAAACLFAGNGWAQGAGAKGTRPVPAGLTANAVLDKSVAAMGGKAAYAKVRTMVTKATVALAGQNLSMSGTVESVVKTPGKVYTRQELSMTMQGKTQTFKTELGFDGKGGWSRDPFGKLRDLTPVECDQAKEQANPDPANWRERYTKAEIIGVRKVEGKDAYALRLTPKRGKPLITYYDTGTFLMVRMDMMQETPQGTIPVEAYYSDYRTVGGIKAAYRIRQRLANAENTITMTSVRVNADVPDAQFARPQK